MRKMGVLGGTFDPIHEGHIALAKEALRHGGLDGVIFLPMAHPAHREADAAPWRSRAIPDSSFPRRA